MHDSVKVIRLSRERCDEHGRRRADPAADALIGSAAQVIDLAETRDKLTFARREVDAAHLRADIAETELAMLRRRIAELEELASTDPLTGLLNRRGLEAEVDRILGRAQRYGEGCILILIDVDGFKKLNDRYGHSAGDAALIRIAEILKSAIRSCDAAARVGGDEFAVVLTPIDEMDGRRKAEEIERRLSSACVRWNGHEVQLTASVGTATLTTQHSTQAALSRADSAMYATKRRRRNATLPTQAG